MLKLIGKLFRRSAKSPVQRAQRSLGTLRPMSTPQGDIEMRFAHDTAPGAPDYWKRRIKQNVAPKRKRTFEI